MFIVVVIYFILSNSWTLKRLIQPTGDGKSGFHSQTSVDISDPEDDRECEEDCSEDPPTEHQPEVCVDDHTKVNWYSSIIPDKPCQGWSQSWAKTWECISQGFLLIVKRCGIHHYCIGNLIYIRLGIKYMYTVHILYMIRLHWKGNLYWMGNMYIRVHWKGNFNTMNILRPMEWKLAISLFGFTCPCYYVLAD